MKVVQINATCGSGSTGNICVSLSEKLNNNGVENYILYCLGASDYDNGIKYSNNFEIKKGVLESRVYGNWGFEGKNSTTELIAQLNNINPDIVHLHNLHSHACSLDILFDWLAKNNKRVIWTFHDCWAFTGYCMHFETVGCEKWKNRCEQCPQKKDYSLFFDKSSKLYELKKQYLSCVDLTVVAPSAWMKNNVVNSFLKNKKCIVINNGIDLSTFRPMNSDFKSRYNINDNKKILLGVASQWTDKKGLDVFLRLVEDLSSEEYTIVLVGTDCEVDRLLPKSIISIHRTGSKKELAEIYSSADVFVNPTKEDTFPTVNIEALACGTPVITFDAGGSAEIIDETCGYVVKKDDVSSLENEIKRITASAPFSQENCRIRAKKYDADEKYDEYMKLYFNE